MKKILIITFVLFGFTSCADLDLQPATGTTANRTFTDPEAFTNYLAKIYGAYSHTGQDGPAGAADISIVSDEGFTSYIRAYWKAQVLTTDEAVIAWTDAGVRDLHNHNWTSENQFVRVLYYRIFYIIALSNDFLTQTTDEKLDEFGTPADWRETIREYRAEVRFLRAMAYWHALDFFREVPLLTRISADLPVQVTPETLFQFIETELMEIEDDMVAPRSNDYGRADQAALWMLQAKIYLNAEAMVDAPKYTEAITALKKVITAGYTLEPVYQHLFLTDNHSSNEIIFPLISDGQMAQNWGSTTFLVHGAIGGTMVEADYGITGAWAGMRATEDLVNKFPDVTGDIDSRAIFYTDGQTLEIADISDFTQGYAVPKFKNLSSAGEPGKDVTHVDTDYPLFRLADAYLMYAEAILRGGSGGDLNEALILINDLRERAYGDASGNITINDLTLDFILDERSRELYWEATRRLDLIRFGQFSTQGIWPWKGGVEEGRLTEEYRNFFPIPASDLIANPRMKQNDPNY